MYLICGCFEDVPFSLSMAFDTRTCTLCESMGRRMSAFSIFFSPQEMVLSVSSGGFTEGCIHNLIPRKERR